MNPNPNQALWEKGDSTRIAATMRESGDERFGAVGVSSQKIACVEDTYTFNAPVAPAAFFADFRTYYGPTMNAFAAAEQNGKAAELQQELDALFESQNRSNGNGATSIPATFLRVTVTV